jgi:hypothetical protein
MPIGIGCDGPSAGRLSFIVGKRQEDIRFGA